MFEKIKKLRGKIMSKNEYYMIQGDDYKQMAVQVLKAAGLAADIADRGIVLTGGGSLLRGLEDLIAEKTGINTMTAEDPMTAVAIGTGKYVEFLAGYKED